MFDFFSSMETGAPGEVEMVSLVPEFEDEIPKAEEEISKIEEEIEEEIPKVEEKVLEVEEEIPEIKEEIELEIPEMKTERKHENIAMSRSYTRNGLVTEIAYINYNKVRITKGDARPIIKEFASTKEAVDYYVEQMQELEADE